MGPINDSGHKYRGMGTYSSPYAEKVPFAYVLARGKTQEIVVLSGEIETFYIEGLFLIAVDFAGGAYQVLQLSRNGH